MIESKRSDKKKNQAEIVKALMKDPTLSERQLAEKTGLSNGSAHNHKKEIEQSGAKGQIMDRVLSNDKEIMDLVAGLNVREFKKIVEKEDEDVTLNDLKIMSDIAEKSTKRLAIFGDKNDKPVGEIVIQL